MGGTIKKDRVPCWVRAKAPRTKIKNIFSFIREPRKDVICERESCHGLIKFVQESSCML